MTETVCGPGRQKYLSPLEGKFADLCPRGSMNLGPVGELGLLCVTEIIRNTRVIADTCIFCEQVKASHRILKGVCGPQKVKNPQIRKFLK